MKKKSLVASLLVATSLLTACSSGVSEKDFKALEDRVTALEQGDKQVEPTADKETATNKETADKKSEQEQATDTVIKSKEGVEVAFAGGGIIEDPKSIIGEEAEEEGVQYVYTILDWEYIGTEQSYAFGFYDLALTDGEITVGNAPFINYDSVLQKLNLEGVKTLPTPLSPKESGKTLMVFKVADAAYAEADFWMLTFEGQDGAIPVTF